MDRLRDVRRGGGGGGGGRPRDDDDDVATPRKPSRDIEMDEKDKPAKPETKTKSGGGGLSTTIGQHMKQYDDIKEGLAKIKQSVVQIDKLKEKEQKAVNDAERKANMAELDRIMAETSGIAAAIKKKLEVIKEENDKYAAAKENMHSATTQMRVNMYQTHIRRFHQEMNNYNQAAQDFKTALKDRTRRQLPILIQNITPDEVEKIVESGHADEVISQALVSEDLDNVIAEIEERHQGIMKLERQVMEVYELFRDLATLVDLQQETMDVISERIERAKDYTADGEDQVRKAREHQKAAAKRQCCILVIVLGILVAILAPVLATQLKNF